MSNLTADRIASEVGGGSRARALRGEAALAVAAFAALCVVVLSVAPQIAEPDDGAYHHSIVAVTMGDFLDVVASPG